VAGWASADLLDRFYTYLGRGSGGVMQADELWTDVRAYGWLADAQEAVYSDLAPMVPHAFINAPVKLVTADGGVTYTWPAGFTFGHIEIYAQEAGGRQLFATSYGNVGGDFVMESTGIRSPGDRPLVFANGPWGRATGFPSRLSAAIAPALQPEPARELILWRALSMATDVSAAVQDGSAWDRRYTEARKRWLTTWSTQYSTAGNAARNNVTGPWWLYLDAMNGAR